MRHSLVVLSAAIVLVGCGDLTEVDAPDVVTPSSLETPAGALVLFNGAVSLFQLSFSGIAPMLRTASGQVVMSGVFSDELTATQTQLYLLEPASRTVPDPISSSAFYTALQKARVNALNAVAALQRHRPTEVNRIGRTFAFAAYTELFFGENFCSGIPLANVVNGTASYGPSHTTTELFEVAIAHFDSALAYADSLAVTNLAAVGMARALLNLGQFADAAAVVAAVPDDFLYEATHSAAVQPNGYGALGNWVTVPDREGGNGLDYRSAADPRVPLQLTGKGLDGVTDVYAFVPQNQPDAPVPLASGTEARLIEAEAALQAGDVGLWLGKLNALRGRMPGLAPLVDPGAVEGRVDLHMRERAFWLFLTGHRHGDLRRLVRQYGRAPDAVFPVGQYRDGLNYGSDVTLTPPASERDNPQFQGCLDRGA